MLSVVIPTHKRADILARCLEHLERQTIAKQLEVIVVSDGHDEKTAELMEHILRHEHGPKASLARMAFIEIPKSQQGVARNRGVQEATGEIVLFIGDDALLAPDACKKHLATHNAHSPQPIAVLGFTTWDPAVGITPVMRWLEKTGWQFGYPLLTPHAFVPAETQHRFTYTSHVSVPRSVALAHPFRTDVTLYGWEDILWGQELRKSGIPLFYEPDAKALHHHHVSLEDSLKRMETLGQSLTYIKKTAPDLDRKPEGLKLLAYRLISLTPTMRGRHYNAFLKGLVSKH